MGQLSTDIGCWQEAATAFGCNLRVALIWLSGNDIYQRAVVPPVLENLESEVTRAVDALRQVAKSVPHLGPLPRYCVDADLPWTDCAAYQYDRQLMRLFRDAEDAGLLVLGRYLTRTFKKWRILGRDSQTAILF